MADPIVESIAKAPPRVAKTPRSTADGWTLLTLEQPTLGYRYLEIMRHMNRKNYSPKNPARQVQSMATSPSEYYHFSGMGFELVIGFRWITRHRHYRVMSTGFVGDITPVEALDRLVAKGKEFYIRHQLKRLVAIRPREMDSPRIIEMYDLLSRHPALKIRGGHHVTGGECLWIRLTQHKKN